MKTALELNITPEEHLALQAVAAGLASGAYKHLENQYDYSGEELQFNMNCSLRGQGCGTVGCIGGWVGLEMGRSHAGASNYVMGMELHNPLYSLYYPGTLLDWNFITPAIAAEAIYEFLDTGSVNYPALLATRAAA